ncbi:MAG: hypothetical protein RL367_2233 [Pseudomonadota bacterium]|jgi:hypothetical protein
MSLVHLTKVAFGCPSLDILIDRIAARAAQPPFHLTTRNRPKRLAELDGGSLYWIVKHRLVARCAIIGFADDPDRKGSLIQLEPRLMLVRPYPCRAHQGWRYLEDGNAPEDLGWAGEVDGELPEALSSDLLELGLI